jgi:site-specific recombinase XerC
MSRTRPRTPTVTRPPAEPTELRRWLATFLADQQLANHAASTIEIYVRNLGHFLAFLEGEGVTTCQGITPDHIRAYLLAYGRNHTPGGVRGHYRCMRTFLRFLVRQEALERNPIDKVPPPRVDEPLLEPVSLEAVAALLATCDGSLLGLRDRALLLTLLDTGLRRSDMVALDVADVDFDDGAVFVRHSKSRRARTVFLSATTRCAVEAYLNARPEGRSPGCALWLACHTYVPAAAPDTTAPETTVLTGPDPVTTSRAATITFASNDAGSTFTCSLDGAAFKACVSPVLYTNLSVAAHGEGVRAADPAGNVDSSPATYSWTIQGSTTTVPTCTAAPLTLTASGDAWIDQNSASNNFGTDSILRVQAKGGNNFRALVRFAMPSSMPPGCIIGSATLRMYAASAASGRTLQALQLAGIWAEDAVTWSNQPPMAGATATTDSGSGWRTWNVAPQVQAMYDTGTIQGFLIRDATEEQDGGEQQFHGREKGSELPTLAIQFAQAPGGASVPDDGNAPAAGDRVVYLPMIGR